MNEGPSDLELRRRQLKTRMSTVATRRQQAVCVRRAYKRYGSKSNPNVILDGLNMTVPKGCIYGLLGASGCGKTTLLSCIVGRKRLNSGEIWVWGGTPGSRGSGVPGPRIGYMPQEIALYGEFSIRETLKYFGWINGMSSEETENKLQFFVDFLMLPDADRLVKNLSGGQQRRVSLAATLVHEPELLILDEPTVGVDPLLRQNIWNYLVDITKGGRTTVIITTHYIDETRQAHQIGLLRGGYFLAEESPDRLIRTFAAESLEDVFLKLSVMQNRGKRRRSSILQTVTSAITVPAGAVNEAAVIDDEIGEISGEFGDNISVSSRGGTARRSRVSIAPEPTESNAEEMEIPPEDIKPVSYWEYLNVLSSNHMGALIWKNFLWMVRNAPVMAFILGLPVLQTILFCYSIGHDPKGITLSIFNQEIKYPAESCQFTPGCNSTRLSCNYLDELTKNYSMELSYYDSEAEARNSVVKGNSWAMLLIHDNFSQALKARLTDGKDVEQWDLDASTIEVYADKSNENVATFLTRDVYFGFEAFFQSYLNSCDIMPAIASLPIKYNKPIYGPRDPDFTDFAAPGVVITIIYFMAVALTSGAMLMERNEGILERSLVNGVTGMETLFSLVLTQFIVMVIQTAFVLCFAFGLYGLTQNGSWVLIIALTLLSGLCGMTFGFVVACACDNERSATYMALGSFLPIVMLCGIVWPIESMNQYLKYASFVLPLTQATDAMRCVIARGWGIEQKAVYEGFLSITVWILIFLTISILVLKFKKG